MHAIALKMLTGDRAKYLGLIAGIMFATLLMSQQVSIFVGIMARTGSQIRDIGQADIWLMHPEVQYIEEIKPMPDKELVLARGVEGVKWAVPLYKGLAVTRAAGGVLQQSIVMGVDDSTLTGQPPKMILGSWESLRGQQAVIMDKSGYQFIWPNQPLELGREIEINDQRAVIVGICDASPPFLTFPLIYARYSEALRLAPGERNRLSFVLIKAQDGEDLQTLKTRLAERTHMQALTAEEFHWRSIEYYLKRTGIGINFGTTVLLGFIIGAVVAGQTFYIFIMESLKQFGVLKALGVTNRQILGMVLLQALVAGALGFSIGIGLCAFFFNMLENTPALKGFTLYWQVAGGTAIAISIIILIASVFSIRRVLYVDPAIVFRG